MEITDNTETLKNALKEIESLREQRNILINFLQKEDCWVRGWISGWRCFVDAYPEAKFWPDN